MNENVENKENFNEEFNINPDETTNDSERPADDSSQVEKLQHELNESKDRYLRLAAEFDNFRKRTAKERLELFQTAGKDVIVDLLDILDDSDRALAQAETLDDTNRALKEGMELIFNKLRNILQSKGLKVMETVGADFDPELHDAIAEIPAPSKDLKGKVVDEVAKGYYLNDKIIRHAKVVVGK